MDFKTFMSRLEEVENIGRVENGYSHIICEIMYNNVWKADAQNNYMLVDTSTYQRTAKSNKDFLGENICAVPDFVITNKTDNLNKINSYGCIEVKFCPRDVNDTNRLDSDVDTKGYLDVYNKVIYTNGWIWNYYDKGNYAEKRKPTWSFDFKQPEQCNEARYNELIDALKDIKWEEKEDLMNSIVDCIYEVGEKADLREFLNNKYRNPYPTYYIAQSICNEIPKDSNKYKEIKKYIDSKLGMRRGCRYDAIVRIIWAAIRYSYPKDMGWDKLSSKFKKPVERPCVIIGSNDSIESIKESVKEQVEAYFDIHKNISEKHKEYIRANIDECESIKEIKALIGFLFSVTVKSDS